MPRGLRMPLFDKSHERPMSGECSECRPNGSRRLFMLLFLNYATCAFQYPVGAGLTRRAFEVPAHASAIDADLRRGRSEPFTFSEIAVNELRLFWSGFESDRVGNIAVTGAPISAGSSLSANTCNGQSQFPSIASGTTRFPGLTLVHPLTLGPSANFAVQVIPSSGPLMAFACPAGSGPSGPCVNAVNSPGLNLSFPHLPAGDYEVVIGRTDGACGNYHLSAIGSPN
jgi:hypothetical protein